jgi:hypothetical protein
MVGAEVTWHVDEVGTHVDRDGGIIVEVRARRQRHRRWVQSVRPVGIPLRHFGHLGMADPAGHPLAEAAPAVTRSGCS